MVRVRVFTIQVDVTDLTDHEIDNLESSLKDEAELYGPILNCGTKYVEYEEDEDGEVVH